MKSTLKIPPLYRYWLRPGGTKGTTKLSSSSPARVFPFCDFLRRCRLDPPGPCACLFLVATTLATSGRVYRHASHSPACPCSGGSWFPIQSPPPCSTTLPLSPYTIYPSTCSPTRSLVVVGLVFLMYTRENP